MTIDEAKLHWQTAKDAVEHTTYLRDLAFENYIKVVANDKFGDYYALISSINQYRLEDKKNKRMLNFALRSIVKNARISIDRCMCYGWDEYAQSIVFKYKGTKFEVMVPDTNKLNKDNFAKANEGMLVLYYEYKPSCWEAICTSYNIAEVREAFGKFVDGIK